MADIIYHYTNLNSGFKILEPEKINELKFINNENNDVIDTYAVKSKNENDDVLRRQLLSIYSNSAKNIPIINIWASDISKLNDKTEMDIGIRTIRNYLNEPSQKSNNNLAEIKDILNNEACLKNIRNNSYIISFSENEDDLTQWRLYSNNAQGLSIGFDKKIIKEISHQTLFLRSFKVVYTEEEYKKFFNEIITEINDVGLNMDNFINSITGGVELLPEMKIKIPIINQILQLHGFTGIALSYKKSCFLSENEYRIYINPIFSNIKNILENSIDNIIKHVMAYIDHGKCFRSTQSEIIQYKVLPVPINSINKIYIGPKNHTSVKMLRDLLLSWGYNHKIDIIKSEWTGIYY